jgi:PAS domain S-box-containing protein
MINEKQVISMNKGPVLWMASAVMMMVLVAGVFTTWWVVSRTDLEMRKDLLQNTQMVSQAVYVESIKALTGTKADLDKPDYQRLKKQFATIRMANPQCRFVYLMGRRADGTLFFFVDSELPDSKDYSPPGQVYENATDDFRHMFDTKTNLLEGPLHDEWGVWVSALVPMIDKKTGAMIAVMGMDVDARTWKWDLAAKAALPVVLMFVLLSGMAATILSTRNIKASPKPILWRLLPPLMFMIILLTAGGWLLIWQEHRQGLALEISEDILDVSSGLPVILDQQASVLAAVEQPIAADPGVQKALRERDADRLLAEWRPVFETLRQENQITQFYFFDKNRVCILRVHNPDKRGDLINRFTALEAERTGKTVSGIELGSMGILTLRVVRPVFEDAKLVGYLELGKEIGDTLQMLHTRPGNQLAVTIYKKYLTRQTWEEGMRMLGKEANWDHLSQSVVIYATQGRLPEALASWIDKFWGDNLQGEKKREIISNEKDWWVSAIPLLDASGKEIGNLLVIRDITLGKAAFIRLMALGGAVSALMLALLLSFIYVLLRRTDVSIGAQQVELRKSEAQYSLLADNMTDSVWLMDMNLQTTYNSPSSLKLRGYTEEELRQLPLEKHLTPASLQVAIQALSDEMPKMLADPTYVFTTTLELEFYRKDGTSFWSENTFSLIRDDNANPVSILCEGRDITERKLAEKALKESEELFRGYLEHAPNGIYMSDLLGTFLYVNRKCEEIVGYSREELIGKNILELNLLPEKSFDLAVKLLQANMEGKPTGPDELELMNKDGFLIPVEMSTSVFERMGQKIVLAFVSDITERKHAEAEILKTNSRLEEAIVKAETANIAKSQFLANMSHEIRTPMNGVIGMIGLLLDTELNEEQRRYAETVHASGESLLVVINDILDFSKIEARKIDLETLEFDLSSLLDDFTTTLAVRAQQKDIELFCALDPSVPVMLKGDPGRLRQILTNLTGNAVKFTHAGEVAIRVSLVEKNENDVLLRFSVRDMGIGIPKDKIPLLFNKFSQVDASTTRKYGGTGLGLAIAKQLVEMMGGEIGVESEEGKGSDFWFTVRLGMQTEGAQAVKISPANLNDVRVLIVDDNATSREILNTHMASWGMRPTEAENGPDALHALYQALNDDDPFRTAVIDMQMPGMSGEALGRAINADPSLAGTRMVMLTSLGERGDARLFEDIGFAAYTNKPIRRRELKAVLSLVLTEPTPRPIVTRHTAREMLNQFRDHKALILVAEDNITNQQVALGILKKLGLKANAVANGAEAMKALSTIPYDLVLMDVQMPVMDGLEATREIRKIESAVLNHGIPIIAMTAHAMQGDKERCLEAGMDDYITKPVDSQALSEILDKWLPKEQAPVAPEGSALISANKLEAPVFDRAGMMARMLDDEVLAKEIVAAFLDDIPRQIETLQGYLEAGDVPGAERQAHTIKGASANVGGEAMRAVAFEMEKAARASDLDAVNIQMIELKAQFEKLKQSMMKII